MLENFKDKLQEFNTRSTKRVVRTLVCLTVASGVLFSKAIFSDVPEAEAGVLYRSSNALRIRVPRIRDRSVLDSTVPMERSNPDLRIRRGSLDNMLDIQQKQQRDYNKALARWTREKEQIERRIAKIEKKREEARYKEELKAYNEYKKSLAKSQREKESGNVARDPRSWFKTKIVGEKTDNKASTDGSSSRVLGEKKQKLGFWDHIKRALGLK